MTPLLQQQNAQTLSIRKRDMQILPEPHFVPEPEPVLSIAHYLWLMKNAWWKIALTVLAITGLATVLSFTLKPVYESTVRLAIDLKTPSTVIGEGAVMNPGSSDADQFFNTELQLIQSDTVLRPVAEQFGLNTASISPKSLPAGMKLSDAPVTLSGLSVVHPPNSFLINISYRARSTVQAAAIANAIAHSYILRTREMRAHSAVEESSFMEKEIEELKKNMDDSALALANAEKQMGVINPEERNSILAARLAQLNTEYTEAQNERMRKQVDFSALQSGSEAAIQVSPQASALAKMEENVRTAQQRMESVKTIYGTSNAEYKRAANELAEVERQNQSMQEQIGKRSEVEYTEASHREKLLQAALLEVKGQSDSLNAHSMEYQELKREAEANKTLYTELYRKVKEAGINGAFQSNAIRIADAARPQLHPVFPNKIVFIGLGFMLSLLVSIVALLLGDMTDKSLRDPDQTRRAIGLDVLGILPHVRRFEDISPLPAPAGPSTKSLKKAPEKWFGTTHFYQEGIQALLSTILAGRFGHPLRSIMVTSAAQGEGKSSCIAHLASSYAMQGYRTLLIDADLRCPTQQGNFLLADGFGLADAILERKTLSEIRRRVPGIEKLDLITAGRGGSRVSDRIGKTVEGLLKEARAEYDMVFIDAPPMLCFAEPIQLAGIVDGVLVVCRAGATSRQEVAGTLSTLRRCHATPLGLVLNHVRPRMSSSYGPYQMYYRHMEASA